MSATRERRVWPELVGALLYSIRYSRQLKADVDDCLLPIPWDAGDRSPVPYGAAELPYLKRALYGPDGMRVARSLQALVEHAHDHFKAMDMLRQDVLSPLNRLTKCAEPFVRQRCCVLIRVLAGQPFGKVSVVRNAALVRGLMALAGDAVYAVRLCGAAAVAALAEHRTGNETMVALGCADRALYRAYVEPDDRVVLALLCTVGRLMDTNRTARERTDRAAAALGRFFGGPKTVGRPGRVLIDHLTRGVRSPDYRTAADAATCLARAAAVPVVRAYLARDRGTVDLLVSLAVSPELRARPLRALSVRLLCSLVGAPDGLVNVRAAAATAIDHHWAAAVRSDDDDDPATQRCLRKLAAAVRTNNNNRCATSFVKVSLQKAARRKTKD